MKKFSLFFIFLLSLTWLTIPAASNLQAAEPSASLFFKLDEQTYLDPEIIKIDICLDTDSQNINAFSLNLDFATNSLKLIKIEKEPVTGPFFIKETTNNQKGNYLLLTGSPTPLVAAGTAIAHLTFKKIKIGWTDLKINENSLVLAANGAGTNILTNRDRLKIYLIK
jgi:hypothetical protein